MKYKVAQKNLNRVLATDGICKNLVFKCVFIIIHYQLNQLNN